MKLIIPPEEKYTGDISTSRADHYQYLFQEKTYSHDFLNSFTAPEVERLSQEHREQLWDLEHQLEDLFWYHIEHHLTQKQTALCQILKLAILQGEGQCWIAEQLGVGQPSVQKMLHGSSDYQGGVVKRYGGIAKKLSNLIQTCPLIHHLMFQIEQLDHEQVRLPHFKCFKRVIGSQYQDYLLTGVP